MILQPETTTAMTNGRPNQTVEDTGLSTRVTGSTELAPTSGAAEKQFEIQSAIVIARRFPRSEDAAYAKLMASCQRQAFAEAASYSFPRGGSEVSGPSVDLAREAARIWGNIRYGLEIVRDDDDSRQIRGWAWDLETNVKTTAEDEFRKLVQRKAKGGGTQWIKPDERDLRELTNRRGAILVRNCLLQLLPKDLVEEALLRAKARMEEGAKADPDAARRRLIEAFGSLGVSAEQLEQYLGHPLAQSAPKEIAALRQIYASIRDGNSTWSEYSTPKSATPDDNGAAPPVATKPEAAKSYTPPPAEQEAKPKETPKLDDGPQLLSPDRVIALSKLAAERGLDADAISADICGSGLDGAPASFDAQIMREIEKREPKKGGRS